MPKYPSFYMNLTIGDRNMFTLHCIERTTEEFTIVLMVINIILLSAIMINL